MVPREGHGTPGFCQNAPMTRALLLADEIRAPGMLHRRRPGRPHHTVPWTGVRNYQARNFMRDAMRVGDGCCSLQLP